MPSCLPSRYLFAMPSHLHSSHPKAVSRIQPYTRMPHACKPSSQQSRVYLPYAAAPGGDIMARSMGEPRSSWPPPSAFLPRISPSYTSPYALSRLFAVISRSLSRRQHPHRLATSSSYSYISWRASLAAWRPSTPRSRHVSDCTSDGSRAHVFLQFSGVSYVSFTLGPALGTFLIRRPLFQSFDQRQHEMHSVTVAFKFWAAILCSSINLILSFIIPESLDSARRLTAQRVDSPVPVWQTTSGLNKRFLIPLAVFAPHERMVNGRMRKDWSISWLATAESIVLLAGVPDLSFLKYRK